MNIQIGKGAGFCMGVRRAVEMALDSPGRYETPIYTYGPLIHNPQVLEVLKERGINVLLKIPPKGSGTVLVRAHGVPPEDKEKLKKAGFYVIDATCPRVIRVQTIIRKHAGKGFATIIIGDRDHPEVKGLLGYAGGNGFVVETMDELHNLTSFENAIIVAQTTQNSGFYKNVKAWANEKYPHYITFDTICDSTEKRQTEVSRLADSVDTVIVVGGCDSGNTRRLAEIVKEHGKTAYHIETEDGLDEIDFKSSDRVGITAGASTPNWIINSVQKKLESIVSEKDTAGRKIWSAAKQTILFTHLYLATGAGFLFYASTHLQQICCVYPQILMAALYVLCMHLFNNLTGRKADRYNNPDRANFYKKYTTLLFILASVSGVAGLGIALKSGVIPFILLLSMSITGTFYNFKLIPDNISLWRYRSLREIPGSKTVFIAGAWAVVIAVFPPLIEGNGITVLTLITFIWVMSMVFVRTAFFDILDMQGDRIVGKETIPILLGEKKTLKLLKKLLWIIIAFMIISTLVQITSWLAIALCICPIALLFGLRLYNQKKYISDLKVKFIVESQFIIAGIIAVIWKMYAGSVIY
ncbi:MAG: 4-hydroxy-3-methylbut-2-enyl diphosphate reductase [Desulfobacterales bacterium]|nr:4-hydroxy-3-methylbut-2-enyl diphosphate reductase [Desulfobacterales bacterium]